MTTPEAPPPVEAIASAAQAVVIAAETAVALAEGQSALAIQDAAERIGEHSEEVAEVAAKTEEQDRSIEALWRESQEHWTRLHQMGETLESLRPLLSLIPPPSPLAIVETETGEVLATEDPETAAEVAAVMIEHTTPPDTSDPTSETQTEHSDESGSRVEPEVPAKKRRWI